MRPGAARSWLEVSASALRANLGTVQRFVAPLSVMPVLKANGYGHGLTLVAEALEGCAVPFFAVDSAEEAQCVAQLFPRVSILILGYVPQDQLREAVGQGWSFVCSKPETAQFLAGLPADLPPARIHLEIETGLYRQGAEAEALSVILKTVQDAPTRFVVEGVSSHFANVEEVASENVFPAEQETRFFAALKQIEAAGHQPLWRHLACSAAGWVRPFTGFSALRLGISLYGIWSSLEIHDFMRTHHPGVTLQPALTWKTFIAERKTVPPGASIGYGRRERVARQTELAVLPVGYYDGFDRRLSERGEVLIRGRRCRVLGRVCMNMCMVDVTDVPDAALEEEVVIFGEQGNDRLTPEDWERVVPDLIAYEAVARLREGLPRVLVEVRQP